MSGTQAKGEAVRRPRSWLRALPNLLSGLRLFLAVVFPWMAPAWRLPVLVVAAATDVADGAASRLLVASTTVGRFLDPLADKAFVLSAGVTLLVDGALHWAEALVLTLRDLGVLAAGLLLLVRVGWRMAVQGVRPSLLGKLTSAGQFVYLFLVLWGQPHAIVLGVTGILSAGAALTYLWDAWRTVWAKNRPQHSDQPG